MQSKTGLLKLTTIIAALLFWSLQSFSQQPSKGDLERGASIQQEIEDVKRALDEKVKRNKR